MASALRSRAVQVLPFAAFLFVEAAWAELWQDTKDMLAYKYERSREALFDGRNDYYLSGLIWHAPWAYSSERRGEELNEAAWGGGFGRSVVDEDGDAHSLYATVFRDSHYEPQYNIGYLWMRYWPLVGRLQGGLGYSVFVLHREDLGTLPGILPGVSLRYRGFEVIGTFLPGFTPGGNVGYIFARFNL